LYDTVPVLLTGHHWVPSETKVIAESAAPRVALVEWLFPIFWELTGTTVVLVAAPLITVTRFSGKLTAEGSVIAQLEDTTTTASVLPLMV
jgi:hypothetical protein